jgi:nucleotide-binding universal stress UspA family protein
MKQILIAYDGSESADRALDETARLANGSDVTVVSVDEAEQEHADLIVVGMRGLSTVKGWMLGSVSSRVMHHAPCNVLVVR